MMIRIAGTVNDSIVDGPGLRFTVFTQGCRHNCPGCHNPESWDINAGTPTSIAEILDIILADPFADVTFSGGDPMFQPEGFAELARAIRAASSKSIWCYTGFTFEQILANPRQKALLSQIDVLVDGPFIQSLRDESLLFRGSSNQRIINVSRSLESGTIILEIP